jgi:hypothetical protein
MGGGCSSDGRRGEACTGFWWGNLREREQWGDPGVDGRTILRRIFRKWDGGSWTASIRLRKGQVADTCKCSNELSGSVKYGEFLDWLKTS